MQDLRKALAWSSWGMEFALALALFTVGGKYLDGRFDTSPLFTLLGFALGFTVGFYALFGVLRRIEAADGGARSTTDEKR